ncbi:MAG: DUF3526 domain-containing protein [Gemmatimonadaceae bacterium]|nr:DUF3526 domain-containing protein [Gemmatimonadaceae bacterium]
MFARILRHDWRMLRADLAILAVAVIFGTAIALALANGAGWTAGREAVLAGALAEEEERFAELQAEIHHLERDGGRVSPFRDPRNPSTLGHSRGGRYAVMPPGPLAAVSIGQSDLLPSYYRMSMEARELMASAAELENPHRLLAGRFDLAFVIIYLYPLLILVLGYNLLSAEKEQGTLTLTLSQPVRLRTIVAAKVILRGAVLLGLAVALCALGLVLARTGTGDGTWLPRLALWCLVVAAYGGFWFALAALIASFGRPSATNAMVLAGAWLVLVVILPASLNLAVTTFHPVPSRVQMIQAIRLASDEATAAGSRVLAQYYEDHPELAADTTERAMTDFSLIRVAVNDEVERQVQPVVLRYHTQLEAQQRAVSRLRYLSPAIVAQDAMNDIAGTGTARHRHFVALVDDYHREWREFFVPLIFQRARVTTPETIPRFAFREEPFRGVVARTLTGVAALALPAGLLAWAGLRRLRRFPVTA